MAALRRADLRDTRWVAIAERLSWAVSALAVRPADRVLEIGCGQGIAVELICQSLISGRIVAVDRSGVMVDAAVRRNRTNVAGGKATIVKADTVDGEFDKIFAVNVSAFWMSARQVKLVKPLLAPGGRLYLFHQPPNPARNREVIERATGILAEQGFSVADVLCRDMAPAPAICLVAGVVNGLTLVNTEVSHHAGNGR